MLWLKLYIRFLFRPNASLYNLSKLKLKETNPALYSARNLSFKLKWIDRFTSKDSYGWIALTVLLPCFLCFLEYNLFFGTFTKEALTAKRDFIDKIIDQRINNIVTLTSISLVVVGWLINNLKEKTKETYSLLFSAVRLYPIVYYILSVIILLLIISSLRNRVGDLTYFHLMMLALFYIVLAIFFIGFLFNKLFQFADATHLSYLSAKLLVHATKQVLYREKIRTNSQSIFSEYFKEVGFIVDNPLVVRHPVSINITPSKVTLKVIDVDIQALRSCIKNLIPAKTIDHLDIYPLAITERIEIQPERSYMFVSTSTVQVNALKIVANQYVYTQKGEEQLNFDSIKLSLYEKSQEAVRSQDQKTLELVLANYELIYENYFESI